MKFEYFENKWGMSIMLEPETPKEFAQVLRMSKNAKAEKPNIFFSFSDDKPVMSIDLAKVRENVQRNSIKPGQK